MNLGAWKQEAHLDVLLGGSAGVTAQTLVRDRMR
jgi:hypothetical protein